MCIHLFKAKLPNLNPGLSRYGGYRIPRTCKFHGENDVINRWWRLNKMTISAKFKSNHFPNFHRHPLTPPTFIGFNYCIYNSEIFMQILPTFTNFLADSSVALGARRSPRTCRALCLRPSAARAQWCEPRLRGAWGVFGTQKRWKDIINHQTSTKLKSYLFLSVFWWLYGGLIFSFLHQQRLKWIPTWKKQRTTFDMLYSDLSICWILK